MGEPDSNMIDSLKPLVLSALKPGDGISAILLRKTGLHRDVLQQFFDAIKPEIKDLVGWRPLREYEYDIDLYRAESKDIAKAREQSAKWVKNLREASLGNEKAILIYDGEILRAPAKDYRLYLLRDERVLYYAGGLYADYMDHIITCGDVLSVLDAIDKRYSVSYFDSAVEPFIVIMTALCNALDKAIASRQQKIAAQESLKKSLLRTIKQVSNK